MGHWAGPVLTIVGIAVGMFGLRQTGLAGVVLPAAAAAILLLAAYVTMRPDLLQ